MAILIDRHGALWLARPGNGGIEHFPPPASRGAAQQPESERLTVGLSSDVVVRWLEDREGNVWAGTTGGLDRFRRAKLNRVELTGLQEDIALAPADSGAVWVGSAGRHLLRLGDGIREFPEVARPVELAYRDRAGVAWMGSPFGLWRSNRGRFVRVALPDVNNVGLQAATHDRCGQPLDLHRPEAASTRRSVSAGCRSAIGRACRASRPSS